MALAATQKKRAQEKASLYAQKKRSLETTAERDSRLAQQKERQANARATETADQRSYRLASQALRQSTARAAETPDEEATRLALDAERHAQARAAETPDEEAYRLALDAERHAIARAAETSSQRSYRLTLDATQHAIARAAETAEDRSYRLASNSMRNALARAAETIEEHDERLRLLREAFANRLLDGDEFYRTINTFCDRVCDICLKQCYPNQVVNYRNDVPKSYLPQKLADKSVLVVCHRCNTHLKNGRKTQCPPKAYWNNLDPGSIPDVIKVLTEPERRLLGRVIAFTKVVKFDGRFGQYGFKGNAILFALDIFQVTEKLPEMLPRSSNNAGIVVVTETLENLNRTR